METENTQNTQNNNSGAKPSETLNQTLIQSSNEEKNWLTLNDYSSKYRVSVSTLRRRIKTSEIEFCLNDGKYLLEDAPLVILISPPATTVSPVDIDNETASALKPTVNNVEKPTTTFAASGSTAALQDATLNMVVSELKKAYMMILQEKEQQILYLREEISDLKTLVKVLEEHNNRKR